MEVASLLPRYRGRHALPPCEPNSALQKNHDCRQAATTSAVNVTEDHDHVDAGDDADGNDQTDRDDDDDDGDDDDATKSPDVAELCLPPVFRIRPQHKHSIMANPRHPCGNVADDPHHVDDGDDGAGNDKADDDDDGV